MVNIFEIIEKVTSRIEPFHSEFLTNSFRNNKILLNKFFLLIRTSLTNDSINKFIASEELIIVSEDLFFDSKRIDLTIKEPKSKNIIGIEVKTSDASVSHNQLSIYHDNMIRKYSDYNILIVFLTPFNKQNLPHDISPEEIHAINEFSSFHKNIENSIHINWDDVVDLYENTLSYENKLYIDHKEYIKTEVTSESRLKQRIINMDRNRGLAEFFGEECVGNFFESLLENNITYHEDDKKMKFNLAENANNFDELINTFQILTNSDNLQKKSTKTNKVNKELIKRYENGSNGIFFRLFFSYIENHSYLWLEGKARIGIRASHNLYKSSGVSVFTIDENNVIVYKNR